MVASQEGHVEVVDKLLQHGATVDLQNAVFTFIAVYIATKLVTYGSEKPTMTNIRKHSFTFCSYTFTH